MITIRDGIINGYIAVLHLEVIYAAIVIETDAGTWNCTSDKR